MSSPFHYEQYPRPVPAPVAYVAPVTDQQPISIAVVVVAWIVTLFSWAYLLPWAIAASRGKANQWAVLLVSLFLGWTVVGWIVALVMSLTAHRPIAMPPIVGYPVAAALPTSAAPAGWYPNPGGPGQRYWDGSEWTQHYA